MNAGGVTQKVAIVVLLRAIAAINLYWPCSKASPGMPVTRLLRGPKAAAQAGRAVICAALALEAETVERQFESQTWGPEVTNLSELIARAADDGCRGIVSYGVAGGLCPDLRSGDIVVGSAVVGQNGRMPTDDVWSARLLSIIPTAVYGPIAAVAVPISAGASRGELWLRWGAMVADMESHIIARLAAANSMRFVALRVVIDAAGRNIPPSALACVSSEGEISRRRLSRLLLRRPSDTLDVIRLSADWRLARKALLRCCDALGSSVHGIDL